MKNFQDLDCVEVDRPVQCREKYLFILLFCDIELHVAHLTHEMEMAGVIQYFHNRIKCRSINILCTCCDQLWYLSLVTKCDANKIL